MANSYVTGYTVNGADVGSQYMTKDFLMSIYPNFAPGVTAPVLWACGYNATYGSLGVGDLTNRSSPVQVGSTANWKQISLGIHPTISAIKADGTLWFWGNGSGSQTGNGVASNYSAPVQIGAVTTWKQVSVGSSTTLAVRTDGTLWAWGSQNQGQFGVGTTISNATAAQVGLLTNWSAVSCGYASFGIKTDGTLWSWGPNGSGQLGLNDIISRSSPVQVGALTNWQQVSTDLGNTIAGTAAIKTDGTLWTWGGNTTYGMLGQGDTVNRSSPVQVGLLTNWKQVKMGSNSMHAVKTDGTLWGCGYNLNGALGLGDAVNRSSPVQVGTLTNWKQVSASTAVKTDGTLWAWGVNTYGMLGQGNTLSKSSPVQVGSLTNWIRVESQFSATQNMFAIQDFTGL